MAAESFILNHATKRRQAGSSLDLTAGATLTLTLADGTTLSHNVAIGE